MSAIAGRVLQIHKGAYDATTAYSPLDEVLYQGSTYVCKQNSTGNLPTNTTYWQLVAQKGTDATNTDPNAVHWAEREGYVGKNELVNEATSQTLTETTFTVNTDKSVKVNTTSAPPSNREIVLYYGDNNLKDNVEYLISDGVANANCFIAVNGHNASGEWQRVLGRSDVQATFTNDVANNPKLRILLIVKSGATFSNVTFYPMIRKSSILDSTYEPYLTPNTEIDNKLSYADNAILGAHNILNNDAETETLHAVDFTVNADKSITVNGTPNGDIYYYVAHKFNKVGTFRLNGMPLSSDNFRIYAYIYNSSDQFQRSASDRGLGAEFTINEGEYANVEIVLLQAYGQVDNVTIYPMISIPVDNTVYAKPSKTNIDLTDIVDGITTKTFTFASGAIAGNSYRTASKSAANGTLTPIGVIGYSIEGGGNTHACLFRCDINGTDVRVGIINLSSSEITPSVDVTVLYKG